MKKTLFLTVTALYLTTLMQAQQVRYCYNIGAVTSATNFGGIAGLISSAALVENETTLYLNILAGGNSSGTAKLDSELKNSVSNLNGTQTEIAWISDVNLINDNYPILAWQANNTTDSKFPETSLAKAYYNSAKRTIVVEGAVGTNLRIINMQGRICIQTTILNDKFEINIDHLNTGCYVIILNKGPEVKTTKFIK